MPVSHPHLCASGLSGTVTSYFVYVAPNFRFFTVSNSREILLPKTVQRLWWKEFGLGTLRNPILSSPSTACSFCKDKLLNVPALGCPITPGLCNSLSQVCNRMKFPPPRVALPPVFLWVCCVTASAITLLLNYGQRPWLSPLTEDQGESLCSLCISDSLRYCVTCCGLVGLSVPLSTIGL